MNAPPEEETAQVVPDRPLVLVATADVDLATYVRRCLIGHYRVVEAHDGEAAVRQAAAVLPALILIDVPLPPFGGYTLCRLLQAEAALLHIPVVLMTGSAMDDAKERTGGASLLMLPFNGRQLLAALKTAHRSARP